MADSNSSAEAWEEASLHTDDLISKINYDSGMMDTEVGNLRNSYGLEELGNRLFHNLCIIFLASQFFST